MEMIIMVSVLSTLGVVALFTSIVVMFRRLKSKVDVIQNEKEIDNIYNQMNENFGYTEKMIESSIRDVNDNLKDVHRSLIEDDENVRRELESLVKVFHKDDKEIVSLVDSRCDKLDRKIMDINENLVKTINSFKEELSKLQKGEDEGGKTIIKG
jgi:biopolymer transport protein ExbB/TolQ